jgi:hypothetical protein
MLYILRQYSLKSLLNRKQVNKGLTKNNLYILLKAIS